MILLPPVSPVPLCCAAPAAAPPPPSPAACWQGIPPRDLVTIHGASSRGAQRIWSTYRNGTYLMGNAPEDFFRVPAGLTLVILQADLTFSRPTRKFVNLEFLLKGNGFTFPLARATVRNLPDAPAFTATKTFPLGLMVPPSGQLNVVDRTPASVPFEVMLYGYFTSTPEG